MIDIDQLDYINYWNHFRGNYKKGLLSLKNILSNSYQAEKLVNNPNAVSVLLDFSDNEHAKRLRRTLLSSSYSKAAAKSWVKSLTGTSEVINAVNSNQDFKYLISTNTEAFAAAKAAEPSKYRELVAAVVGVSEDSSWETIISAPTFESMLPSIYATMDSAFMEVYYADTSYIQSYKTWAEQNSELLSISISEDWVYGFITSKLTQSLAVSSPGERNYLTEHYDKIASIVDKSALFSKVAVNADLSTALSAWGSRYIDASGGFTTTANTTPCIFLGTESVYNASNAAYAAQTQFLCTHDSSETRIFYPEAVSSDNPIKVCQITKGWHLKSTNSNSVYIRATINGNMYFLNEE